MQFWILVAVVLVVSAILGVGLYALARRRYDVWEKEKERAGREAAKRRAQTEAWTRVAQEIERAA